MVFSHGSPLSADAFENQMFFLARQGDRCIAHDRRGTAGFIKYQSHFQPDETMGNLAGAVAECGLAAFLRLGHAAAPIQAGPDLRPTQLLMFGRAEGGTPLMQANQTIGVDLPLRALMWCDPADRTCTGYDDPLWLAERHGLTDGHPSHAAEALLRLPEACVVQAAGTGPVKPRGALSAACGDFC
ncbi:Uncharacterized conserved protein, DUF302 family [Methylobacterium sp. UNC378MF]|nr:Uncharacterized conserved protein, DUF302 family [Methylobacterium sp. UNC378MF]